MNSRNASTRSKGCNTGLALLCSLGSFGVIMPALATTTVTKFTYDAGDHIASVIDPRGLVTTYTHDGLGQLWQQVSPDTGTTTYNYDGYGRRSSLTRADNTQTTYGYDGLNRITSVTAGGQTQTFTYDSCTNGIGRLCSDSDATGATSYTYTPEGWIAGRGFSIGGTIYALGYGHDSVGHITTVNYPDGNQAIYSYTQGMVSGITLNVGGVNVTGASAVTYRPMNAGMSSWTSSNGVVNTLNYDTDGRLTGISAGSVQSLGYSYDQANRIVGISNGIDGSMNQNFGYDDESRLVSVYSGADIESYQYDLNGNRIGHVVNGSSTADTVSTTNNQQLSSSADQYGYDARGNATTVNGAATYQYDAFNRMSSAAGMAYYVNPEGQRLRKSGAAGTSYFAPDRGGAMLAEYGSGGWIDYVWLNGRLIGRVGGGQHYAIHDDHTGRPEAATDGSGAVVWRAQNFAFTQKVTNAGMVLNLGFPGQYYDAETGLWNNGFRDYKSTLGRYVESDPLGLAGGVNTYAYVGGNPLSFTDRLGLRADTDLCAGLSAQGCMQLGEQFAPDYVTANVTVPSIFSFGYTLTRDGSLFGSGGFTFGSPASMASGKNWGFSISAGNLTSSCHTNADVDNFVRGGTKEFGYYDIVGGGIATNPSGTAIETGFGFGGASGGYTYSGRLGSFGHGW